MESHGSMHGELCRAPAYLQSRKEAARIFLVPKYQYSSTSRQTLSSSLWCLQLDTRHPSHRDLSGLQGPVLPGCAALVCRRSQAPRRGSSEAEAAGGSRSEAMLASRSATCHCASLLIHCSSQQRPLNWKARLETLKEEGPF